MHLSSSLLSALEQSPPARVVVVISGYRQGSAIRARAQSIAPALRAFEESALLLVDSSAWGQSGAGPIVEREQFDVRTIFVRPGGLTGRGELFAAALEAALALQAETIVWLDPNMLNIAPDWVEQLAQPVVNKTLDYAIAHYTTISPPFFIQDSLMTPLAEALFGIPLRHPLATERAMSAGIARYIVEADVWETDVARYGIDAWLTMEVLLNGARVGAIPAPAPMRRAKNTRDRTRRLRFLQQVGTFFRFVYFYRTYWHGLENAEALVQTPAPQWRDLPQTEEARQWLMRAKEAWTPALRDDWKEAFSTPEMLDMAEAVMHGALWPCPHDFWARCVYDLLVLYHQGDGDPDRVIYALFPLYLARAAALDATWTTAPEQYERVIAHQIHAFWQLRAHFIERWNVYLPPEQRRLLKRLGLL
ncbi:hypothetical protein ARMA_2786 [Ardenticatena maritima]|uniref:Glycosyltransferase 2-like domain-containing protein n=1 Tax=Ardenticatena maritima TaxID=872965 RepID=A0A0M8K960_9CHLR|nr:hypothetical protein [Ardenticatena maritima]KPL87257.1 hypothetical protein SE16_12190 [Ardenticatena maritima]GAP64363.1 hypothetical protein ARMA_2786 [Ardenticatena maritima]